MVGNGRATGQTLEADEAYKYFRVTNRATGQLKPVGAAGGPSDRAECLFCGHEMSCQKNRLLSHLAAFREAAGVKACLGPKRSREDTDAAFDQKSKNYQHAREKVRTRLNEEAALGRKRKEVC